MVRAHAVVVTALLALASLVSVSHAKGKSKVKYVYIVTKVEAAKGVTNAPVEQIRKGLLKGIEGAEAIAAALPEGAPDPVKNPKAFKRFLAKKKLRAFRVNLEIVRYELSEETIDDKGHKRVGAHINARLFGETIPDRTMAFAGAGSATVKLDVGKRVRDPDRRAANREAIAVAVEEALNESLTKLKAAGKKKKKRRRKK